VILFFCHLCIFFCASSHLLHTGTNS
jgi:hypothetical protein